MSKIRLLNLRACSCLALALLSLFALYSLPQLALAQAPQPFPPDIDYPQVVAGLNMTGVEEHIRYFSGLGNRMTAHPGCTEAATYIYNFFDSTPGLENVTLQTYEVVVPASFGPYGANLTVLQPDQRTVEIHALMPNNVAVVNTGGKPLRGPLIYGGGGRLEDLDGKPVEGSILLMDFNSRQRWLQAADLGAKAVIFLEPYATTRTEADMKYLVYAPASFPRFYAEAEEAAYLLGLAQEGATVEVSSNQQWLTLPAQNVWALLRGTEAPDMFMILAASFDTQSAVPMVSPGASEACSISALLELAKYFSQNRPKVSLLFAAFSGNKRWGAGVINWVEKYFYHEWFNWETGERTPFIDQLYMGIEIDVTPDNHLIYPSTNGKLLTAQSLHGHYLPWFQKPYWGPMVTAIREKLNKEFRYAHYWPEVFTTEYTHMELESVYVPNRNWQAWGMAGLIGFSLATVQSLRPLLDTPIDTYANLPSLDGLRTQLEFAYCALSTLANDPYLFSRGIRQDDPSLGYYGWRLGSVRSWPFPAMDAMYGRTIGGGFLVAEGRVITWNASIGFYSPVKNALVYVTGSGLKLKTQYITYFETTFHLMVKTDENGTFRIPGWQICPNFDAHVANGYVVNSTGHILYAPDYGRYKTIDWKEEGLSTTGRVYDFGTWTVFECGAIALFNVQMPNLERITEPVAPRRAADLAASVRGRYLVGDSLVHTTLDQYSVLEENMGSGHTVAVVFVTPNKPVEIIYGGLVRRFLLLNATRDKPTGHGYLVHAGEQHAIRNLPLTSLEDVYLLNDDRTRTLLERELTPTMVDLHQRAGGLLTLARQALSAQGGYSYTTAFNYTVYARALEQKYWMETRETIKGTANTIVYFAALLIPFVFLAEGLLVHARAYRRALALALLYVATLAFFWLVHPGFAVAVNPPMVLVGFATVLFIAPLFIIVYSRSGDVLKEIRRARLGPHFPKAVRFGAFMESITVGIENLRKRRLRTGLTLSAITAMCLSIVLFSSLRPIEVFKPTEQHLTIPAIPYKGVFIKLPLWDQLTYQGIGEPVVEWLRIQYGDEATVAPRTWLYTSSHTPDMDGQFMLTSLDGAKEAKVRCILGATPEEKLVRDVEGTLLPGGGWFEPGWEYTVILSNYTAQKLGVQVGDKVNLMGMQLAVVGVFGWEFWQLCDIDQEGITPVDKAGSMISNMWEPAYHHFSRDVIIMPYDMVLSLAQRVSSICGFWDYIASVSIAFEDEGRILEAAEDVSSVLRATFLPGTYRGMYVFASVEGDGQGKIYQVSLVDVQTLGGMESQIAVLALVYLSCLNLLLGSVHERTEEIATYSSLGLSPSQIGFMFVTESAVYAVVGAVLGYIGAIAVLRFLAPPGISVNFASEWVTIAVLASVLVTLGASLYPAFKASRIVTPSLERKFRIPTKPLGDEWEIPLPFSSTEEREAQGMLAFMAEWVRGHLGVAVAVAAAVFTANRLWYAEGGEGEERYQSVRMTARLAPYDRNVAQETHITTALAPEGRYGFTLYLRRETGTRKDWEHINYSFVDAVRKQLLVWRALTPSQRQEYVETAAQRLREMGGPK